MRATLAALLLLAAGPALAGRVGSPGVGPAGQQGPAGATGATGAAGTQGPAGAAGAAGAQGAQGPKGDTGAVGATGPQGATGLTGATGPQGPIGLTGAAGAAGPAGPTGATGPQGATGASGVHVICTATTTSLPAISLGGTSYLSLAATCPGGATFTVGDSVTVQALADLPGGENIAYSRPSAVNTVRVAVTGGALAISLTTTTISWLITVNR